MVILTSLSKLEKMTKDEADYMEKYGSEDNSRLLVVADRDNIPVALMQTVFKRFGNKFELVSSAESDFALGLSLGIMLGKEDRVTILLDKKIDVNQANICVGLPEKKTRKAKTSDVTEPVTEDTGNKERRHRQPKPETQEIKMPVSETAEEILPAPQKTEPAAQTPDDLREQMKSGKNKELARIASNESLYKRLITAVKGASDPRIGLEMLLNVHLGKDITPMVIKDIQTDYYKAIRNE